MKSSGNIDRHIRWQIKEGMVSQKKSKLRSNSCLLHMFGMLDNCQSIFDHRDLFSVLFYTHTHTHTHIYIYIYIYMVFCLLCWGFSFYVQISVESFYLSYPNFFPSKPASLRIEFRSSNQLCAPRE